MNDLWTTLAARADLTLSAEQHAQLSRYLDLLTEANTPMNLTRITDRPAAEVSHVGDALTVLPFLPKTAHRLVDVGSGGGVPGLPLAIARPDVEVILLEATQKKTVFLGDAASALGLANVRVVAARAEQAARGWMREACDVAVARAVGGLDFLVEWCLPLVSKGGRMLAMKGQRIADELPAARRAIHMLGGGEPTVHPVELPGTEHHVIVENRKTGTTIEKYPRDPTIAKGKPLGR